MKNITLVIIILVSFLLGVGLLVYKEYSKLPSIETPLPIGKEFDKNAIEEMKKHNLNDFGLFPLEKNLDPSRLGKEDPFYAF